MSKNEKKLLALYIAAIAATAVQFTLSVLINREEKARGVK